VCIETNSGPRTGRSYGYVNLVRKVEKETMTGRQGTGQSKGRLNGAMLFDKCNGLNALDLVHALSKGWRATNCTTPDQSQKV
jgi:hypothetical protein